VRIQPTSSPAISTSRRLPQLHRSRCPTSYSLDEATQAWEPQASSPGKKIIVIP
jgi:hypothetical protein